MAAAVKRPTTHYKLTAHDLSPLDKALSWAVFTSVTWERPTEIFKTTYAAFPVRLPVSRYAVINLLQGGELRVDLDSKNIEWKYYELALPVIFFYEAVSDECKVTIDWLISLISAL